MRLALLTAAFLPLVAAPEFTGVTAEKGTKVTKTFANFLKLELVDVSITVDGEEQELPPDSTPRVTLNDEEEVTFTDQYVAVKDGRAVEILRTFESLMDNSTQTIVPPGGEEVEKIEIGESDLLDRTVRFVWDADEGNYSAAYEDAKDADASLLDDLQGDADFLFLLSDEPMEVGSSWEIDVEAFDLISNPSGDLHVDAPESDADLDDAFTSSFRDNLGGELRATVESIEDDVVTILLEGEITTAFDVDSDDDDAPGQAFAFTFEISGKLLWNLESGVASEFQFGGDVEMSVTTEGDFGEVKVVQVQMFEGAFESTASFE